MFGVEYSKDNFTLLRFIKPQLGINEHVCVYKGDKGERTVLFSFEGKPESFIIPLPDLKRTCRPTFTICNPYLPLGSLSR